MKNKITNMIKRSYITLPDKDDKDYSTAQVGYFGRTSYIQTIYPYGMSANAPANTLNLTFNVMAQEENLAGFPYAAKERFKNLKEGEVIFGSPITKSYVKFLANGDIEILSKQKVTITTASDVDITSKGNINIITDNDLSITAKNININSDDFKLTSQTMTFTSGSFSFGFDTSGVFQGNGKFNFGTSGAAIARLGDQVTVSGVNGTITSASPNNTSN